MLNHKHAVPLFAGFVLATAAGAFLRLGITSACWMLVYAGTILWVILRWRQSLALCARVWIVFVPPLFTCLSAGWSLAPAATLTAGVQMVMTTLIAVRLAGALSPAQAIRLLTLVLLGLVGLSLANGALGFLPPAWEHNGALLGMFTQKNGMGKTVVLAALAGIALCWQQGWRSGALALYAGLIPVVLMTRSAGAVLTFAVAAALFPLLAARRLPAGLKAQILCLCAALAALWLLAYVATGGSPRADLLALTGKSQTLTGRLDIWKLGLDRWQEDWLFGIGFRSFWVYDTYAVRRIHAGIEDGLYWFHNIYVDILVAGGLVGALVCALMLAVLMCRAFGWYGRDTGPQAAAWLMILVVSMIAGGADNVMFTPHGFNHMLIVIGFVFATRAHIRRRTQVFPFARPQHCRE